VRPRGEPGANPSGGISAAYSGAIPPVS